MKEDNNLKLFLKFKKTNKFKKLFFENFDDLSLEDRQKIWYSDFHNTSYEYRIFEKYKYIFGL
jgi:hypothetical protein